MTVQNKNCLEKWPSEWNIWEKLHLKILTCPPSSNTAGVQTFCLVQMSPFIKFGIKMVNFVLVLNRYEMTGLRLGVYPALASVVSYKTGMIMPKLNKV